MVHINELCRPNQVQKLSLRFPCDFAHNLLDIEIQAVIECRTSMIEVVNPVLEKAWAKSAVISLIYDLRYVEAALAAINSFPRIN